MTCEEMVLFAHLLRVISGVSGGYPHGNHKAPGSGPLGLQLSLLINLQFIFSINHLVCKM